VIVRGYRSYASAESSSTVIGAKATTSAVRADPRTSAISPNGGRHQRPPCSPPRPADDDEERVAGLALALSTSPSSGGAQSHVALSHGGTFPRAHTRAARNHAAHEHPVALVDTSQVPGERGNILLAHPPAQEQQKTLQISGLMWSRKTSVDQ
jgi:hypothetical protein